MRPSSPILFTNVGDDMIVNNTEYTEMFQRFTKEYSGRAHIYMNNFELFDYNFNNLLWINKIQEDISNLNCFFDRHRRVHFFLISCIHYYTYSLSLYEIVNIIDIYMKFTNNFLPLYNIKNKSSCFEDVNKMCYDIVEDIFQKRVGLC